jgi:hypothetical protein
MMTSLPSAVPQQAELFSAVIRKPFTPDLLLEVMHASLNGSPQQDEARARNGSGDSPRE